MSSVRSPTPPTAVLISHLHHDHLDLASLDLLQPGTTVVVPKGARAVVRGLSRFTVVEVAAGESVQWPVPAAADAPAGASADGTAVVRATAVPALHDGRRFRWGPPLDALGYVVQAGATRVYFAGDTDLHPAMDELGGSGLTAALLPIGGWGLTLGDGHLDPVGAAEATRRLRPRLVLPVHWGSLRVPGLWRARAELHTNPGPRFVQEVRRVAPETRVVLATPGVPVYLPPARVSESSPGSG